MLRIGVNFCFVLVLLASVLGIGGVTAGSWKISSNDNGDGSSAGSGGGIEPLIDLDYYLCEVLREFDLDQFTSVNTAAYPQLQVESLFTACEAGDVESVSALIASASSLPFGHAHDEIMRILVGLVACQDPQEACAAHSAIGSDECDQFAAACLSDSHGLAAHYLTKLQSVLLQFQSDTSNSTDGDDLNRSATKLSHLDSLREEAALYCSQESHNDAEADAFLRGAADGVRLQRFFLDNPDHRDNLTSELGLPNLLNYAYSHELLLHCMCQPHHGQCLPHTLAMKDMLQPLIQDITQPIHPNLRSAYGQATKHVNAKENASKPLAVLKQSIHSYSSASLSDRGAAVSTRDGNNFAVQKVDVANLLLQASLMGLAALYGFLIDHLANDYLGEVYGLGIWVNTIAPTKVRVSAWPRDYQVELRYTVPTETPPLSLQFALNFQFPNDLSLNGKFGICIAFFKQIRDKITTWASKLKYAGWLLSKIVKPIVNAVYGAFHINQDGCLTLVQVSWDFLTSLFTLLLLPMRINLGFFEATFAAFFLGQFGVSPPLASVGMKASYQVDFWFYSSSGVFIPAWTWPAHEVWKAKYTNDVNAIPPIAIRALKLGVQPAVLPATAASYLNCYADSPASRLLTQQASGRGYTAQTCMNAVWDLGDYFGLENGGECWYGQLSAQQVAAISLNISQNCNTACTADSTQRCGASSALDMWAVVGNPNPTSFTTILPATSSTGVTTFSFSNATLYSPYQLAWLHFDAISGNAVVSQKEKYSGATFTTWQSATSRATNASIAQFGLFKQCQLCVTDSKSVPIWCTPATAFDVSSGCKVRLYDNGLLGIVSASGSPLWWPSVVLLPNVAVPLQKLPLKSPTGVAALVAQGSNVVALNANGAVTFSTQTAGTTAASIIIQNDCNLCLYSSSGSALWCSLTTGLGPFGGCFVTLDDTGNVVIVDNQANPLWTPGVAIPANQTVTFSNLAVYSPMGQTKLTFQSGGNLVVTNNQKQTFSTNTLGATHLSMQADCNLCIFDGNNRAMWCSATAGAGSGCQVLLSDCGFIYIQDAGGNMVWPNSTVTDSTTAFSFCQNGPVTLQSGGWLLSRTNDTLTSPSALATLVAQSNGNVVLSVGNVITWQSATVGVRNVRGLTLQPDCDLVLTDNSGNQLWHSNTGALANTSAQNSFGSNCVVDVTDCGTIRILNGAGEILWAAGSPSFKSECYTTLKTSLDPNSILRFDGIQSISSSSGRYVLTAQANGNLALSGPNQLQVWSSATTGTAAAYLLMRSDCNLCIYPRTSGANPIWCAFQQRSTVVGPAQDCQLQVNNCGVVYLVSSNGTIVWAVGAGDSNDPTKCGGMLTGDVLTFVPAAQSVSSPNGGFSLQAQTNGDLVFTAPNNQQIWHSNTAGSTAKTLVLQQSCQLQLLSNNAAVLWSSPAPAAASSGNCSLAIDDCGLLTLYDERGTLVSYLQRSSGSAQSSWLLGNAAVELASNCDQTSLAAGRSLAFTAPMPAANVSLVNTGGWQQTIISANGFWRLTAQLDGNLCLYGPSDASGTKWCTGTKVAASQSAVLVMQNDCNLCISVTSGSTSSTAWCSGTSNAGSAPGSCTFSVSNCGALYISDSQNGVVWQRGTSGFGDPTRC